jgi:RimJ/RimL family protein N-acetyltransferase
LRSWRCEDAGALVAAWDDEAVRRWTGVPDDRTVSAAVGWIGGERRRRRRRVALDLVVAPADRADDRVLGEVGLGPIQWDRRRAMIGYWTAAGERGRGVATEAVGLLSAWSVATLPLDETVAETAEANPASAAVLRTNGFDLVIDRHGRQAWRCRRRLPRSPGRAPGRQSQQS